MIKGISIATCYGKTSTTEVYTYGDTLPRCSVVIEGHYPNDSQIAKALRELADKIEAHR